MMLLKVKSERVAAARDCTKDSLSVRESTRGRGALQGRRGGLWECQGLGQRHTVETFNTATYALINTDMQKVTHQKQQISWT